ncbi:hypothetical protein ENUP19_0085G0126 [Entamoeba nuttalli]
MSFCYKSKLYFDNIIISLKRINKAAPLYFSYLTNAVRLCTLTVPSYSYDIQLCEITMLSTLCTCIAIQPKWYIIGLLSPLFFSLPHPKKLDEWIRTFNQRHFTLSLYFLCATTTNIVALLLLYARVSQGGFYNYVIAIVLFALIINSEIVAYIHQKKGNHLYSEEVTQPLADDEGNVQP